MDVKAVIDDYLEADRLNRKDTKTHGANAFIFQADVMRRNFEASQPLLASRYFLISSIFPVMPSA